jgi:hypothetical protein
LVLGLAGILSLIHSFAPTATAALIATSSAPPGSPLEVVPGEITPPLLLSVLDDGTPPQLAGALSGWQFTLMIVPDANARGTLAFESAVPPASNYVLATTSVNFGLTTIPSPVNTATDTLTAFDFRVLGAAVVPSHPGAGALVLELIASPDAQGTFGLFAVGGLGFTEWSDDQQPPNPREFANIASNGLTRIADVRVVPEPASLGLALWFSAMGPMVVRRR